MTISHAATTLSPEADGLPAPAASRIGTLLRVAFERARQERSCRWSRTKLEAHQAKQLRVLRRFVADRSPFYARFLHGFDAAPLERLPILSKATLMENFDALVTDRRIRLAGVEAYLSAPPSDALYLDRYTVLSTSGTTGRRGVFLFDRAEWIGAVAAITRPIAWSGAAGSLRHPPRSALIASATPWHYSARIGRTLSTRLLPSLRLDAATPLPDLVDRLNAWKPTAMAVYPSVLRQLADEQRAGRLKIPLANVATSAEPLTDDTRRRVADAWGIRVFDTYGATEYAPIAAECAFGNKHLFEDRAIVEVVDEHGRRVPAGERGERVLLTLLERRTQPLIRYEISDLVHERAGACACGRPFRMIDRVEGRQEDVLVFPAAAGAGTSVEIHPNLFHAILETVPATGWQVIQDERGLAVLLTGGVDGPQHETLRARVRRMLEERGAMVPAIEVRAVDRLERGATGKAPLILRRMRSAH